MLALSAADKENVKAQLAKDFLDVREKELEFYARNLKMVATFSAIIAVFAFDALFQFRFQTPVEGYLPLTLEEAGGMWGINRILFSQEDVCFGRVCWSSQHSAEELRAFRKGFAAWDWGTWLHQISQALHLVLDALALTLLLWTLYTCVITSILGVNLALRGPDGSVDKAVRYMAQQHQFVLYKFMWGLGLFSNVRILYIISKFNIFIAVAIIFPVMLVSRQSYLHLRELVRSFQFEPKTTVTGQWDLSSQRGRSAGSSACPVASAQPARSLNIQDLAAHSTEVQLTTLIADQFIYSKELEAAACDRERRERRLARAHSVGAHSRGAPPGLASTFGSRRVLNERSGPTSSDGFGQRGGCGGTSFLDT